MENPIKQEIILHEAHPEWVVSIPIELHDGVSIQSDSDPFALLVYRYHGRASADEYRYRFVGVRIPPSLLTPDAADLANASQNLLALLEECYENGNAGETQLYAWFSDQAEIIEQSIEEARQEPPSR